MSYRQLLLDFGRSVMRRVQSSPEEFEPRRPRKRLVLDPLLGDFANQLLRANGSRLDVRVFWNPSLKTTAGIAVWQDRIVVLNPKLQEVSAAEVQRTLRHELAHLLAKERAGRRRIEAHGPEWRAACADLEIPGEARCHDLPFKRRKIARRFFYACPACQSILARVRPLRRKSACLKCCRRHNSGRYHERFRFRPVEAPAEAAA